MIISIGLDRDQPLWMALNLWRVKSKRNFQMSRCWWPLETMTFIQQMREETFFLLLFCCNQINKPSNSNARFAPRTVDSTINSQWLYNFIADSWSDWLPAEALSTLRVGGYYSFVFRPGLRVIVLNNNHCFVFNTWVRVFNLYVFVVNLNTFHFLWIATVGCIIARVKWLQSLNGCVIH